MQIKILGAHATETASTKTMSLLVDDIIALDAGSLSSSLTLEEQLRLKAVLLTHQHYDHTKDIPMVAMNFVYRGTLPIYATKRVQDILSSHLLDGAIYPSFLEWPEKQPAAKFVALRPDEALTIEGYNILPVPVCHSVESLGFRVTSPEGKTLFYTGDTGPGLTQSWNKVTPDLLITEVSLSDKMEEWARKSGHLTPRLLQGELEDFRRVKGHIPHTVLVHLNGFLEDDIALEIDRVAKSLGAEISLGREGMKIDL